MEDIKPQHIPVSLFLERLTQFIPAVSNQKLALKRISTQFVEDALALHEIELEWSWEPVGNVLDLFRLWPFEHEEELWIASPSSGCVVSLSMSTEPLPEMLRDIGFDGEDVLVLGRDSKCIGMFDAQYKHTFVQLPQLFPDPLFFYSVTHEYGEFSNFAPFSIWLQGKSWPTSEHYFQAQKFEHTAHQESVRQSKTPMEAARLGRQRSLPLRRDWESVKLNVMRQALRAKFTQHEELKELLIATHPNKLVEHTRNDSYWGDGGDGRGLNWLGRLLMELREELRK